MSEFEVFKAKHIITEWRDDAVFKTEVAHIGWYDMDLVEDNHPKKTNIIYSNATGPNAPTVPIRRKQ